MARVHTENGVGYAYFSFSEAFVDAVGKALPNGVSVEFPAFLKVLQHISTKKYQIFAMYLEETRGILLWEEDEYPEWLGNLKQK